MQLLRKSAKEQRVLESAVDDITLRYTARFCFAKKLLPVG
jgi:hypothetical protein